MIPSQGPGHPRFDRIEPTHVVSVKLTWSKTLSSEELDHVQAVASTWMRDDRVWSNAGPRRSVRHGELRAKDETSFSLRITNVEAPRRPLQALIDRLGAAELPVERAQFRLLKR